MNISIKIYGLLIISSAIFSCHTNSNAPVVSGNSDLTIRNNAIIIADTSSTATQEMAIVIPEQDFINYAVPKNTKEIIWLKAGLEKGDEAIKKQSKRMLKDYTQLGEQIKAWMIKNPTITIPAMDISSEINIKNKIGKDWNTAWVDKIVSDQRELLSNLKNAQSVVKNSALHQIISKAIPIVETHFATTKKMQDAAFK